MAETNQTINTIIQLRHDTADKWATEAGQATPLKPGEAAVEIVNGKAKLKIGVAENSTFANTEYFGSEEAQVFQSELLAHNETRTDMEVIAALTADAEVHSGDFAIIRRKAKESSTVADFQTSYIYDADPLIGWVATTGNYDATNVYFKENITLAGSYTAVGNVKKSSAAATGTLSAAGKSLAEVMQSIFTQELYPATTNKDVPNISISIPSASKDTSGEVGSSYSLPTATVKVTDVGSYAYGPATGIKFEIGKVTLAQGAIASATNKTTNTTAMVKDSTFTLTATDTSTLYTDSVKTYKFNASGEYTQGAMPVTNLGNDYEAARISAGTATASEVSATRTGYRYMFAGGTTASTVDSAIVRAFSAKKSSRPTTEATALEFTAAGGTKKVVCAYPSGWSGTPYFEMFGLAWGENTNFAARTNINVADARGTVDGVLQGAMSYKVYSWELDEPLEAETTKFRVYFK